MIDLGIVHAISGYQQDQREFMNSYDLRSSEFLQAPDHLGALLVLDNHRFRLLNVLHESHHRIRLELHALISNGLERQQTWEILNFSLNLLRLHIEDHHVTKT